MKDAADEMEAHQEGSADRAGHVLVGRMCQVAVIKFVRVAVNTLDRKVWIRGFGYQEVATQGPVMKRNVCCEDVAIKILSAKLWQEKAAYTEDPRQKKSTSLR